MPRARAHRRLDEDLRPGPSPPRPRPRSGEASIQRLQRAAGNRAVGRILARDTATVQADATTGPLVRRKEVDKEITETISHAPARFSRWNGTFGWHARWRLKLDLRGEQAELNIKVRLYSTATDAQKRAWARAIRRKWSDKFAFCVMRDEPVALPGGGTDDVEEMYPIRVEVEWVSDAANAHYTIVPHAPGDTADGRAGVGGTISMEGWGTADTVDVAHEFGHMLGCAEEYFTTNGVDFSAGGRRQGYRDPGGGVMNNPAGAALARNFETIRREAAPLRRVPLRKTRILPWR